jgi:hypothetical protein
VQECITELKTNPGAICAAAAGDATGLPPGIATISYSGD